MAPDGIKYELYKICCNPLKIALKGQITLDVNRVDAIDMTRSFIWNDPQLSSYHEMQNASHKNPRNDIMQRNIRPYNKTWVVIRMSHRDLTEKSALPCLVSYFPTFFCSRKVIADASVVFEPNTGIRDFYDLQENVRSKVWNGISIDPETLNRTCSIVRYPIISGKFVS